MQVSTEEGYVGFRPITLSIVFQTQKELDLFTELTGYDDSVPDKVVELSELTREDRFLLTSMLQSIHTSLVTNMM